MSRILGLFAKFPQPGQVKTRLASASSPAWAARVALAFLQDSVDRLSTVAANRVLACSPPETASFFSDLVRGRFAVRPQGAGDLGQRMAGFFSRQLQAGAERIVLLGTDSPTLSVALVEQAFQELDRADVVLGPATDGGYYLVGCARRLPPIFSGMNWSSPRVLLDTVARLADCECRLALLPPWYDVDTLEDWWMLCGHLAAWRRAGLDPGVPHTEHLAFHDPESPRFSVTES